MTSSVQSGLAALTAQAEAEGDARLLALARVAAQALIDAEISGCSERMAAALAELGPLLPNGKAGE